MAVERVLVTLDGSKASEGVLGAAHRLFAGKPGRITLLQVGEVGAAGVQADFSALEAATERLRGMGGHRELVIQSYLKEGQNVAQVIIDEVPLHVPNVLAMATHGRTGLSRLVVGSTAETVLRGCDIPMLICNEHAARTCASGRESYHRILVPLDGSSVADLIFPLVSDLALAHEAELVLLRVDPDALKEGTQRHTEIAGYLNHYATALERSGIKNVELVGVDGDPAKQILHTAEARRVDLIAMGTHGRSGFDRLRFGSVAEEVLRHCPCPMILRRPEA